MRSQLPKRQIAPQYHDPGVAESSCEGYQHRSLAIRASTVSQNQPVACGNFRDVEKSANINAVG